MIDFQNDGLEHQVFKLISKMCDLYCSNEFPHFQTRKLDNNKWECTLEIRGTKQKVTSIGNSEVTAINKCASIMLDVLEKYHDKDQYDPDIPDSVFRDNIEQFFDDVKYDSGYLYHLYETDILLNPNDIHTYNRLKDYAKESMRNIYERGEEVDLMSDIVTIRFLIKEKKKRYC